MRYTILKIGMLLGILAVFAIGAQPQNQATREQKAETQSQAAPSRPSGMMGGGMMGMMHTMMGQNQQMSETMSKLMENMAAMQKEKDPAKMKSMMAQQSAMLEQMRGQMMQQRSMMQNTSGTMMKNCPMTATTGQPAPAPSK